MLLVHQIEREVTSVVVSLVSVAPFEVVYPLPSQFLAIASQIWPPVQLSALT